LSKGGKNNEVWGLVLMYDSGEDGHKRGKVKVSKKGGKRMGRHQMGGPGYKGKEKIKKGKPGKPQEKGGRAQQKTEGKKIKSEKSVNNAKIAADIQSHELPKKKKTKYHWKRPVTPGKKRGGTEKNPWEKREKIKSKNWVDRRQVWRIPCGGKGKKWEKGENGEECTEKTRKRQSTFRNPH